MSDALRQLKASFERMADLAEEMAERAETAEAKVAKLREELELSKASEFASERLHRQWHDRALKSEKALRFYARGEHWMGLTEDSETQTVLIATGDTADMNGWAIARQALTETEEQSSEPQS